MIMFRPMTACKLLSILALGAVVCASPAAARKVVVKVEGRTMPWDPGINAKLPFGQSDGKRPVYVWGLELTANDRITLIATGLVNVVHGGPRPPVSQSRVRTAADDTGPVGLVQPDFPDIGDAMKSMGQPNGFGPIAQFGAWGPAGQPYQPANAYRGAFGSVFPSYYIRTRDYPVRINALIGAFVDADGTVIGQPFPIGDYAVAQVPEGAVAIALGLNAESFAYNRGTFEVVIDTKVGRVTVEDAPAP
ncbi:hypothetical protein G4G27_22445 [Sphingomonas sp. So64.6b]|uniref:hypothetical protein n=1 Tax=Sphingomonas sp. So64.6b TaxID=2997354 RepID=UPI0015FF6B88|nr:hypothetical protein [Sphingomonas sp. So64.6b]QNA86431.1 hypothetical protein G4G27_22445 [Sphingomonas sp. So64.6b]